MSSFTICVPTLIEKQQERIDDLLKKIETLENVIRKYENSIPRAEVVDNEPVEYEPLFPALVSDYDEAKQKEVPVRRSNSRKCGICGVIGHYRNSCPKVVHLPKKKTSTWNSKNKSHALNKYTCDICGKQHINKCNLDRHIKKNHADRG